MSSPKLARRAHLFRRSSSSTMRLKVPSFFLMIFTLSSESTFLHDAVTTNALGMPVKQQEVSWMHLRSRTAAVSPRTAGRLGLPSGLQKFKNSSLDTVPSPLESKASMTRLSCSSSIFTPRSDMILRMSFLSISNKQGLAANAFFLSALPSLMASLPSFFSTSWVGGRGKPQKVVSERSRAQEKEVVRSRAR